MACATAAAQLAEPDHLPSWVLLGLGQHDLAEHRWGSATVFLRKAVDAKGLYPEAEAGLAQVASTGDGLAFQEAELRKALSEADLLQVPDDKYALLYQLADLQLRSDPGTSLEFGENALETWREILKDDRAFQEVENGGGLEGYYNALMKPASIVQFKTETGPNLTASLVGLNRLLYLYRHPLGFSLKAHQKIAELMVKNKAYKKAIGHAAFALVGIFSTVIQAVQDSQPDYVFRSLDELFADPSSAVYLGKPAGLHPRALRPGDANPGWFVRYQPIWDYLNQAGTAQTLRTLLSALDGLQNEEARTGHPAGQRPITEIRAEILRWKSFLFPLSREVLIRG